MTTNLEVNGHRETAQGVQSLFISFFEWMDEIGLFYARLSRAALAPLRIKD